MISFNDLYIYFSVFLLGTFTVLCEEWLHYSTLYGTIPSIVVFIENDSDLILSLAGFDVTYYFTGFFIIVFGIWKLIYDFFKMFDETSLANFSNFNS